MDALSHSGFATTEIDMTFDFSKLDVPLSGGAHKTPERGMCAMEMVAWFNGETHSDEPKCACGILGEFVMGLNDNMTDFQRNLLLRPFIPKLVGTNSPHHEHERAEIIIENAASNFTCYETSSAQDYFDSGNLRVAITFARYAFTKYDPTYQHAIATLEEAIKAGPQGDFAHDPVERYEALKQLVSA